MSELFSCRNCIHNCGQSLLIGRGSGFCLQHGSVIWEPLRTTCKYLHRKDLPRMVVDEGLREHAAEFAGFSALADLVTHEPIARVFYSEKFAWERREFDPVTNSLALYHKTEPAWIFMQSFAGGVDGRRSLTHASLIRRYMDNCGSWRSSYRFALTLVQELPTTPTFLPEDLNIESANTSCAAEAIWDVFFTRLSGIQEYGFHAGLEELMWATDHLIGALTDFDWPKVAEESKSLSERWIDMIIRHAQDENAFFPDVKHVG